MRPRLLAIAKMVEKNDSVLDVGTDHGLLPIYLSENKLCKKIIASDISPNALKMAENNIKKKNIKNIKLYLSDGLKKINDYFDTLIISGMGTHRIINILDNKKIPGKIILSSHNDLHLLRKYMYKCGYFIKDEKDILDKDKYYVIIKYQKGKDNITKKELKYGKYVSKEYYKYLYTNKKELMSKVNFKKKIKLFWEVKDLKKLAT